ncbi:MAG TPA: PAS domain S-box protein [Actinomycetota bacterium]|nr:PAS domain S-box protein [Actinomycetota bacterium]
MGRVADEAQGRISGALSGAIEPLLLDLVQTAVVATDAGGSITHWNRFAETFYGWSRGEVEGRPFADVIFGPGLPIHVELVARVLSGKAWEGELPTRKRDGTIRQTFVSFSPIRDDAGQPAGTVAICVDITARKDAEQRLYAQYAITRVLAEAETLREATPRLLQTVGETLDWPVGAIWRVDQANDVIRCVDVWVAPGANVEEFVNLTRQTALPPGRGLPGRVWESGESLWIVDVVHDTNFPRAPAAYAVGLHGAFGFPITGRGEILGVIEFFAPETREPDERLLEMMAAVGSRIGQFIERREAEAAVRESEGRKAAILESALDCIVSMDHRGRIIEWNPAAEQTFGHVRDDVMGRPLVEVIIPPALRDRHRRGLARHVATGEARILGQRLELPALRGDGSEFPAELTITRVEASNPPMFTGVIRDITDRLRTEAERERLLEAEQAAREAAERATERLTFLADVSSALASSLDYRRTLPRVARLAIPRVADACLVYMLQEDGSIARLAMEHADPAHHAIGERAAEFRINPDAPEGVPKVLRTGRSELHPEADARLLAADADDPEGQARVLEPMGIASWMCVPLMARGRILGAVSFISRRAGRRYDGDDLAFAEDLARRAAMAIDNARLFEERTRIARSLQRSLLPPELPQIPGLEVAARYRPAGLGNEVGGDFYDLFEIGGGRWGVAVGDVCGKGAEAAALTGLARYTIREAAAHHDRPSKVLASLNQALLRHEELQLCTVAFAQLEPKNGKARLIVSCGGHPLPLLLRANGHLEPAGEPGTILGVFEDPDVADMDVELGPGDSVLFYTDGVTDERTATEGFGEKRLKSILRSCHGMGAEGIADVIDRAVMEFRPEDPRDDVALLVVRLAP